MIGIIIELAVSWLLLWIYNRSSPLVLGIEPTVNGCVDFSIGFAVAVICCSIYQFADVISSENSWVVNKDSTRICGKFMVDDQVGAV